MDKQKALELVLSERDKLTNPYRRKELSSDIMNTIPFAGLGTGLVNGAVKGSTVTANIPEKGLGNGTAKLLESLELIKKVDASQAVRQKEIDAMTAIIEAAKKGLGK